MPSARDLVRANVRTALLGPVRVVVSRRVRGYCVLPYPRHPAGCPKFGRCPDCPPHAPFYADVYAPEAHVVALTLDMDAYVAGRRRVHPQWTDLALRNSRHWQGTMRALLAAWVRACRSSDIALGDPVWNPEAMGVDLTATCAAAGFILSWPPVHAVSKVVLLAHLQKPSPA